MAMISPPSNKTTNKPQRDHHPIPEDEAPPSTLAKPPIDSAQANLKDRVLVGKIIVPKLLNRLGVKNAPWKNWETIPNLHVMDLAYNTYTETFPSQNQAGFLLAKSPWFDEEGNMLCFTLTTPFGVQTYVAEKEGNWVPSSP